VAFVNGNVCYDAFLPHIASEKKMDDVSAKGYAYGYIGGGLQFAIALALVSQHDKVGLSSEHAARIGIAMSGAWWAGFTLFLARYLPEPDADAELPARYASMPRAFGISALGVERTWKTAIRAVRFPHLILFLLAFMLYNEGIQTVINMASIYGTSELRLDASALMLTLLIIQFVAIWGSLAFSRIADRLGTKKAIVIALVLWMGVVIYAYFIHTAKEFFILGMVVGVAMGGAQSLSRSYYGSMIPEEASAEFFGFYTVFTKFSAIWGPWTFAIITHLAGSARSAVLALIVYFILGTALLLAVNEHKAREAKSAAIF
jgi:MFS transporter, UMF1 family